MLIRKIDQGQRLAAVMTSQIDTQQIACGEFEQGVNFQVRVIGFFFLPPGLVEVAWSELLIVAGDNHLLCPYMAGIPRSAKHCEASSKITRSNISSLGKWWKRIRARPASRNQPEKFVIKFAHYFSKGQIFFFFVTWWRRSRYVTSYSAG